MTESVSGPQPSGPVHSHNLKPVDPTTIQHFVKVNEERKQIASLLTIAKNLQQQHLHKKQEAPQKKEI